MSLRRSTGLNRRSELRPDPEKVRTWHRQSMARARQRRNDAPRPAQRRRKVRAPAPVRKRVYRRSGGLCARPGCARRCVHLHHWLDESAFPELALIEDNLSGTCANCNWEHHSSPADRLPWEAIPAVTLRLAESVGDRALVHLERHYPRRGTEPGGTRPTNEEATRG